MTGRRVAARQPGSGTAVLFERLVEEAGVPNLTLTGPYHSEQDAEPRLGWKTCFNSRGTGAKRIGAS